VLKQELKRELKRGLTLESISGLGVEEGSGAICESIFHIPLSLPVAELSAPSIRLPKG
jgi:hypothetical protein